MAAISRAVVCQERDNRMTDKTNNSLTPVATQPGRLPVNQPGTFAGPREVTARQREPRQDLSAGRREQGLVEATEEGSRH